MSVFLSKCLISVLILQASGGSIRLLKRNEDLNTALGQGPSNKVPSFVVSESNVEEMVYLNQYSHTDLCFFLSIQWKPMVSNILQNK